MFLLSKFWKKGLTAPRITLCASTSAQARVTSANSFLFLRSKTSVKVTPKGICANFVEKYNLK